MLTMYLTTRVPKSLYKTVKVFCVRHDVSLGDFITDALRKELHRRQMRERE